jgi:large subunit ribosomal protein L22
MANISAQLNDYRQSPRKVRVVANLVKGKSVAVALSELNYLPKRSAAPLAKLIKSAVANAKKEDASIGDLFIKEMRVDGGRILYRRMPVAHGSADPIRKRTSHIKVVLETRTPKSKK